MALEKTLTKFGATFADAYHRITNLNYNVYEYEETTYPEATVDADGNAVQSEPTTSWVTSRKASFQVSTYIDEDARTAHSQPVSTSFHEFTPDWTSSDNVLTQAYAYLKTLTEYDGAVDA